MADLFGSVHGNKGRATRLGTKNSGITTTAETWNGEVRTDLEADGEFITKIQPKGSMGDDNGGVLIAGNVGDDPETPRYVTIDLRYATAPVFVKHPDGSLEQIGGRMYAQGLKTL